MKNYWNSGSAEQNAVISEIVNGVHDVTVAAGPGSGKTTTALEAMKHLPSDKKIAFVCFNAKIKEENAKKAPRHVHVQTLNGVGWSSCLKSLKVKGYKQVNEYKVQNTVLRICGGKWNNEAKELVFDTEENKKLYFKLNGTVKQLCELARANAVFTADKTQLERIVEEYEIEIKCDVDAWWNVALAVYHDVITNTNDLDWTDQIFQPVKNGWNLPTFDYVFVDEAQDLNAIQFIMIMRMSGKEI